MIDEKENASVTLAIHRQEIGILREHEQTVVACVYDDLFVVYARVEYIEDVLSGVNFFL